MDEARRHANFGGAKENKERYSNGCSEKFMKLHVKLRVGTNPLLWYRSEDSLRLIQRAQCAIQKQEYRDREIIIYINSPNF